VNREDFFIVLNHPHAKFDYPTHYHPDNEINLVQNTRGKRKIGDSVMDFEGIDLVMIGPYTYHSWHGEKGNDNAHVVTIQFPEDLFAQTLLDKKLLRPIKELMERSVRGIEFSPETRLQLKDKLLRLSDVRGFDSILEFLSILYDLAISRNQKVLASPSFNNNGYVSNSRRIKTTCDYIQANYRIDITLPEVARLVNMSPSAFSHFFKKRTSRTFTDYLNDVRIGYATRMLIETTRSISEICFECGFSNISNFNRLFKKKKGQTPSEFRNNIQQMLTKF